MSSKSIFTCVICLLAFFPTSSLAGSPEINATKAAEAWLALVDMSQYGKSWEEAAVAFKKGVTIEHWSQTMLTGRGPLGKVLSRKLLSAQYHASLPGAPDGEYVIIQFETSFENKKSSTERVTPMKEKDGSWRVSGYYIY